MLNPEKLRKLKIKILQGKKPADLKSLKGKIEENFYTGLKHITERHYTEAIKWFQLSSCADAPLIIALLAFKLGDQFLYEEYINEKFERDCLRKADIDILIEYEGKEFLIDKNLKEILENIEK